MTLQGTGLAEALTPPIDIREDAWSVELHHDICVRFAQPVAGKARGRRTRVIATCAWVGRVRRMRRKKDPNKKGGFVEYTRPVALPWQSTDPHVEVQCEWYRPSTRNCNRWELGNIEVRDSEWVHVESVCAPVVISHVSGTASPLLFELDEASRDLVQAVAAGASEWG